MDGAEPDREDDLIARARLRDDAALSRLMEAHKDRLLESIRAELGERVRLRLESQDVMQQVYLDALASIDQFVERGDDAFFRWLRRIAVNRICDAGRRAFQTEKRGKEVRAADVPLDASIEHLFDELAGSLTSPSGAADRADRIRLLRGALDQLGEDQHEVIRLRYLCQLSVPETAAKMDRSERAIRSLCVRALIRLREILGDAL